MSNNIKGLSRVTAEVIEVKDYAYHSSNASGYDGYTYVSSKTQHVKEIFLKTDDGKEKWFRWGDVDVPIRTGNTITVFCSYGKKNSVELYKVINHSTNTEWTNKSLSLLRRIPKLAIMFLLGSPLLSWILACAVFFILAIVSFFASSILSINLDKDSSEIAGKILIIISIISGICSLIWLWAWTFKDFIRNGKICRHVKTWQLSSVD